VPGKVGSVTTTQQDAAGRAVRRLSLGLLGGLVVLVAAGGLGYVVRRKGHDEASEDHETTKA